MIVKDLERAVAQLSADELQKFSKWFEAFMAETWDREFEADVESGKLDALGSGTDRDFDSGRRKPI